MMKFAQLFPDFQIVSPLVSKLSQSHFLIVMPLRQQKRIIPPSEEGMKSERQATQKRIFQKSRDIYIVYIRQGKIRDYQVTHRQLPCNAPKGIMGKRRIHRGQIKREIWSFFCFNRGKVVQNANKFAYINIFLYLCSGILYTRCVIYAKSKF